MIFGIGIDIIEIDRIRKLIEKSGERFLETVFTEDEREYCGRMAKKEANYAARFSAKEAFLKALGTGLANGISWQDISVVNEANGKPRLVIKGKAIELLENNKIVNVQISMSHSDSYATSIVTLENKD